MDFCSERSELTFIKLAGFLNSEIGIKHCGRPRPWNFSEHWSSLRIVQYVSILLHLELRCIPALPMRWRKIWCPQIPSNLGQRTVLHGTIVKVVWSFYFQNQFQLCCTLEDEDVISVPIFNISYNKWLLLSRYHSFFTKCEVISVIQACEAVPHRGWPKHFIGHRRRNIFDKIKIKQNYFTRFQATPCRICGE